jgi:hypothetical protein
LVGMSFSMLMPFGMPHFACQMARSTPCWSCHLPRVQIMAARQRPLPVGPLPLPFDNPCHFTFCHMTYTISSYIIDFCGCFHRVFYRSTHTQSKARTKSSVFKKGTCTLISPRSSLKFKPFRHGHPHHPKPLTLTHGTHTTHTITQIPMRRSGAPSAVAAAGTQQQQQQQQQLPRQVLRRLPCGARRPV